MSNLECIATAKKKVQQEKEDKFKEKQANKARKTKEKKLHNIRKAQEKDIKKLSRDLKAVEQTQKRAGKGKKQGTVPENQIACEVQRSTAALRVAIVPMGALSWASEAPSSMETTPSPLVRTLGFAQIHRGHRLLIHTNPRTLQVGDAVQHLVSELALRSSLDRHSLLALHHRSLFTQRRLSLLEDL